MKSKLEILKLIQKIEIIGATIGFFIIGLVLFLFFKIDIRYLIYVLIFIDIILLMWKFLLEKRSK